GRRHTRCYRDWSSDVCSSDLLRERLQDDVDERRTAGREAGHGIHVLLVHHDRAAHRVEQAAGRVEMRVRRVLPPADAGHARSHLARCVGHGPDYRRRCREDVSDLAESQYRHTLILHRRYSSSRVAASVFSSRYFTMTGVYSEMPHRAADAPGAPRAPGTTTAPAGISSGPSPARRYT